VPNAAIRPLQVMRPASIHLSASRLEQTPVSLMYLLSRNGRGYAGLLRKMPIFFARACAAALN
jgi:hypothetical protein